MPETFDHIESTVEDDYNLRERYADRRQRAYRLGFNPPPVARPTWFEDEKIFDKLVAGR